MNLTSIHSGKTTLLLLLLGTLGFLTACGGSQEQVVRIQREPTATPDESPTQEPVIIVLPSPTPGAAEGPRSSTSLLEQKVSGLSTQERRAVMQAYIRSLLYADFGDNEKALGALDDMVAAASDFAYPHVLRGERLRVMGRIEEASQAANLAIKIDPKESGAYYLLAQIADRQGNSVLYREYLEKCVESGTTDPEPQMALAQLFIGEKRYQDAVGIYEGLIQTDPGHAAEYAYYIGYCLRRMNRPDDALSYYLGVLRMQPGHRLALLEVAEIYQEKGQLDEAVSHYQRAASWGGGVALLAYKRLGEIAYQQERWTDAFAYLREALRVDPKYDLGRKYLGVIVFRSDPADPQKAAEAVDLLEPYVKDHPDDAEALRYLTYAYATAGRVDDAKAAAERITDATLLPEVRLVIARYLLGRNREEEGLEMIRSVRNNVSTDKVLYADSLIALAYLEMAEGRMDASLGHLDRIQDSHHRAGAYTYIATRLLAKKRFEDAYSVIAATQVRAGTDTAILATVADLWTEVMRYEDAEKAYQQALSATPENTALLLRLADLYDIMDNPAKADQVFMKLTDLRPEDAFYHFAWGRFYLKRVQNLTAAIQHFEKAVFLAPLDEDYNYYLAMARTRAEGAETGERILLRYLQTRPENRAAFYTLGNFYLANDERPGHYERARDMYQKAILSSTGQSEVSEAAILTQKARAHEGLREFSVAEAIYSEMAQSNPDSLGAKMRLASYLTRRKTNLNLAEKLLVDELNKGTLSPSDQREALFMLTLVYEAMDRFEDAERTVRKVLDESPFNSPALNLLGYMYAERGVRLDEAEQMIRMALKKEPYSGAYLDSLGWVLYQRGDYENALSNLTRAAEIEGPDAVVYDHLGDCYSKLGRWQQALEAYQKCIAIDPDMTAVKEKINQAQSRVTSGT